MSETIEEVKARHTAAIMNTPGVISMGIGKDSCGNPVIAIGVEKDSAEIRDAIPQKLDGYPVEIKVMGSIRTQ